MLSCNQFDLRRDYPADYRSVFGDDPNTVVTRGGSCIVDPFGNFPMVSFMYRMARNSAAAEDLAQEVFLRVYRSRNP